jgi:hypothetical protein
MNKTTNNTCKNIEKQTNTSFVKDAVRLSLSTVAFWTTGKRR